MAHWNNHHQPENALKRAQELVAIGSKRTALNALQDVFGQRRYKQWKQVYEDIMLVFLGLCLELKDFRNMKEGLYQYRQLCMQSAVYGSLDKIARHLLRIAEAQAVGAFQASQADLAAVDSLEEDEEMISSDSVMLMATTASGLRDRTAKEAWVPWVKFLWESYRSITETLKMNSKLEATYHATARAAFSFCLQFKRTSEFRRLCDMLRTHLQSLEKMNPGTTSGVTEGKSRRPWEGWSERSIERQLQTKFDQLEAGSELGMWNETFKTIEDINKIMTISRKKFKNKALDGAKRARLMATFYDKLKRIFWLTDNKLFHAYTWHKFHAVCRDHNKALDEDALSMQATSVVLAALSIPPERPVEDSTLTLAGLDPVQVEAERAARIAGMINFNSSAAPSRTSILRELGTRGVLERALPQVQRVYALLEEPREPLGLVQEVAPLLDELAQMAEDARAKALETGASVAVDGSASLASASGAPTTNEEGILSDDAEDVAAERRAAEFIASQALQTRIDIAGYLGPIRRVLVLRLLQQLSRVYATVRLQRLYELTERLGLTVLDVEAIALRAVADKHIRAFVDHRAQCLRFPSAGDMASVGETAAAKATRDEAMRGQLTALASSLQVLCQRLDAPKRLAVAPASREAFLARVRDGLSAEHAQVQGRKAVIEARKEKLEREEQERREAEAAERRQREALRAEQEDERLRAEEALRKQRLREKAEKMATVEQLKKVIEDQGGASEILAEAKKPLEDMEVSELEDLAIKQKQQAREKMIKEQQKLQEKAKKVDYVTRALRDSEISHLKAAEEQSNVDRAREHEENFQKFLEKESNTHTEMLAKRAELAQTFPGVFGYVREYAETRLAARRQRYEEELEAAREEALRKEHKRRLVRARQHKEADEEREREEAAAQALAETRRLEDERKAQEREMARNTNGDAGDDDDDDLALGPKEVRFDNRAADPVARTAGLNMRESLDYEDNGGNWKTAGGDDRNGGDDRGFRGRERSPDDRNDRGSGGGGGGDEEQWRRGPSRASGGGGGYSNRDRSGGGGYDDRERDRGGGGYDDRDRGGSAYRSRGSFPNSGGGYGDRDGDRQDDGQGEGGGAYRPPRRGNDGPPRREGDGPPRNSRWS